MHSLRSHIPIRLDACKAALGQLPRNAIVRFCELEKIDYLKGNMMSLKTQSLVVLVLQVDADRNIRHSRVLASNIFKAHPSYIRPDFVDAHHIVGRLNGDAAVARAYLFSWGIGINDADNGVFLPRYATTNIASMPNAQYHQGMHTFAYYLNVTLRLEAVRNEPVLSARLALREIKNELIAGTFGI